LNEKFSDGTRRIRENVVVAYFKVLFRNLPGRTEENHEETSLRIG
jgi:hypothetical protein